MMIEFVLPKKRLLTELKAKLSTDLALIPDPVKTTQRYYLDSFDWRLYANQYILEAEKDELDYRLLWFNNERLFRSGTFNKLPQWQSDFMLGPWHDQLAPILEMRALLPQITLSTEVHWLHARNKDQKTVLSVALESHQVTWDNKTKTLPVRLRIWPVRGYDKPLQTLQRYLQPWKLQPATQHLMFDVLAQMKREPSNYKFKLKLNPQQTALSATNKILLHLLDTMQVMEAGTIANTDSEFLHDFRIAIRRSRAALSQIKGVLDDRLLETYKPELAWLGNITGPTRDLDVYLEQLPNYRAQLPTQMQDALTPLHHFLQKQQKQAQQQLAKALHSTRYQQFITQWRQALTRASKSNLPAANQPVIEVANKRIWKMYRRTLAEGSAITPASPAESYHDLRKTCKKLRYLLEFFRSLYPKDDMTILIKSLKSLQNNLGDFQDFEVQVTTLKQFSQQMTTAPPETFMAIGILIEHLLGQQQQAQQTFQVWFDQFASDHNANIFRGLFKKSSEAHHVSDR